MLEVMQEEELEAIMRQQHEFEAVRNVELVEVQQLEAEERRKIQERVRRVDQEKKRIADKAIVENKIAARCFAQQYLSSLHDDVFETLESQGVFFDPVKKEIEEDFMNGLVAGVTVGADRYSAAKTIADELLAEAMKQSKQITIKSLKEKQLKQ